MATNIPGGMPAERGSRGPASALAHGSRRAGGRTSRSPRARVKPLRVGADCVVQTLAAPVTVKDHMRSAIKPRTPAVAASSLVSLLLLAALLLMPALAGASGRRHPHASARRRSAGASCPRSGTRKGASRAGRVRPHVLPKPCPHRARLLAPRRSPGALEAAPIGGGVAGPPAEAEALGAEGASKRQRGGGPEGAFSRDPLPVEGGETVDDPIDPRFLTRVPFGTSSFWIQPWRSYLDTWPASRLQEALGINFNVKPEIAEPVAQLLQESGFKLARIAITWAALSYEDPTQFRPDRIGGIVARLTALHKHGLRPLILLQAFSGAPTPMKLITLETTEAAAAGARSVRLSAASAARVVPGKSGFNELTFRGDPDILITSVGPGDVATLSRPLIDPLPAGPHGGSTLLYAPFQAPKLPDGQPNPEFQATLAGWLSYVGTVAKEAASIVGPGGFDLEIWNELSFGSAFLELLQLLPVRTHRRRPGS